MIVVDSSALIAITLAQPEGRRCMVALHASPRTLISAATLTETLIVAMGRDCSAQMRTLLDTFGLLVEPVTADRVHAAALAYSRYGKGWHAAGLNYGDSFAYALAAEYDCPLLYVGNDFALTDIASALA